MDLENELFDTTLNEIRAEIFRIGKARNVKNAEAYMAGLAKAIAILANNHAVMIAEKINIMCNNLQKELSHGRE